jgi:CMP-N-acetylneuraminic acid synthetase
VNTEDAEIKNIAIQGGVQVFDRPAELAGDAARSIDVVLHMLGSLEEKGEIFDAVLLLQATYPFRKKDLIPGAIRNFKERGADSLVSVIRVPEHYNPHWCFEEKQGYLKISTGEDTLIPRRQELPAAYVRDGAIYLTKVEVLKKKMGFIGDRMAFIESDPENYINLDGPDDWEKAVQMCKRIQL